MARKLLIAALPAAVLVLLVAALLAVTAVALPSRAEASNLTVRSIAAAPSATAGLTAAADVHVSRTGRTRAARLRFYLSADARRGSRDVPLRNGGRVGRGGPARAIRVQARPAVPPGQPVADYRLIA